MKINIASTHRFHLLDLARELKKQGHDVKFYSYVPKKRCVEFGLESNDVKSITLLALPFFLFQKIFGNKSWIIKYRNIVLDYYMSFFMRPCDIYIALGTVYLHSLKSAKDKFKAKVILEWGSKHIDEQQRILKQINAPINEEYFNERSRKGYGMSDYIAISSNHVKKSFLDNNIRESKLLLNPYGVDLSMFHPTELTAPVYDIIFVGGWRLRKGCDLLIELCEKFNYSLLHVGSITDLSFPKKSNLRHIDSVNQCELVKYYSHAKVFILPSREEGLSMVQAQAVACGLPVVCSKDSGGADLRKYIDSPEYIIEAVSLTVDSLHVAVEKALGFAAMQQGIRQYAGDISHRLSWEAYGKRYNNNIETIVCKPR